MHDIVYERFGVSKEYQGFLELIEWVVALHLTVVTSTNAQSGAAMPAMDARAAWEEPNAGVAHDTTAIPGPTSHDP